MTKKLALPISTILRIAEYEPDIADKVINDAFTAHEEKQQKTRPPINTDPLAKTKITYALINDTEYDVREVRDWVSITVTMIKMVSKMDVSEINGIFDFQRKLEPGLPKNKRYRYIREIDATLPTMPASKYAEAIERGGNKLGYTFQIDYAVPRGGGKGGSIISEKTPRGAF